MGNKFDFEVASKLELMAFTAANTLEVQNGQMEKRFGALEEFVKDSGYHAFAVDMKSADAAIREVIVQMRSVAYHIHIYAEKLRDVV